MLITQYFSFSRSAMASLLAITLSAGIAGCSSDSSTNPNVDKTDSYRVEYVPGTMDPAQGKTLFQISVTDLATNTAVTGESVMLMPVMYMADYSHSTAVDGACVDAGEGLYDCTVYYVMADTMDGVSVGYWELEVMIGSVEPESAYFYPSVGMAMGGTALAKQKSDLDKMATMDGLTARTYLLFKSRLTGTTGDHTFQIYASTMENMMSFPAVYDGVVLSVGTPTPKTIVDMIVEVSTDPTFNTNVIDALTTADGYWTAAGITGLTDDVEGTLYVRLTIEGVTYNSNLLDGSLGEGIVEYATFTVTPTAPMAM